MIGLSVSFCIRDIAKGLVPYADVSKIIGGIAVRSEQQVDGLVKDYCRVYWRECPDEAGRIFRQLFAEGKIEQPRLTKSDRFPMLLNRKHWVETENEITWHDQIEGFVRDEYQAVTKNAIS